MRTLLVDWLVQVAQEFNLLQETLYLSVATLDRFLQKNANKFDKSKLQLIGVSSMFIACKYEEMYAPEIGTKSGGIMRWTLQTVNVAINNMC